MKKKLFLLIMMWMTSVACSADLLIDSFDDISGWSGSVIAQGTAPGHPVQEGTGSLVADYTPYGSDNYYINRYVSLDLSPAVIGASEAAISLWMWIGKMTVTARLDWLCFETSPGHHFEYDPQPWNYTLPIGWNQLLIAQSSFTVAGSPDWSNITNIRIFTSAYNDNTPTDVVFDDLQLVLLVEGPCHVYDMNGDCIYDLIDFALATQCWLVDCSSTPSDSCCDWR
jgi:hypothetical protein